MMRELQGSTFFGEDIAIPHARVEDLDQPVIALGLSAHGIFEHETGRSTRIMFLLLSPGDDREVHLKLLGEISKMSRDDQFRKKLLAIESRNEVLALFDEIT